jgi:hypothetical protein
LSESEPESFVAHRSLERAIYTLKTGCFQGLDRYNFGGYQQFSDKSWCFLSSSRYHLSLENA